MYFSWISGENYDSDQYNNWDSHATNGCLPFIYMSADATVS